MKAYIITLTTHPKSIAAAKTCIGSANIPISIFDAVTEGIDAMLWSVNLNTLETTQVSSQHLAVGQSAGGVSMNDKIYFDCISP